MKRLTYIGFKAIDMGFDAHMTLLYTGRRSVEHEETIKSILDRVAEKFPKRIMVLRQEIKCFGKTLNSPAITVMVPDRLIGLRQALIDAGTPNPSEYEWNPHITLDLTHGHEVKIPLTITLTNLDLY